MSNPIEEQTPFPQLSYYSWPIVLFACLLKHLTNSFLTLPIVVYHKLLVDLHSFIGKYRLKILPKSWQEELQSSLLLLQPQSVGLTEVFGTLDTRMKLDEKLYPLIYFRKCNVPNCFPRSQDLQVTRPSKNIHYRAPRAELFGSCKAAVYHKHEESCSRDMNYAQRRKMITLPSLKSYIKKTIVTALSPLIGKIINNLIN